MSDISEQRRYYERMIDEIAETCREQHEKLQSENEKLRELATEFYSSLTRVGHPCPKIKVFNCKNHSCPNNSANGCRLGKALLAAEVMGIEVEK